MRTRTPMFSLKLRLPGLLILLCSFFFTLSLSAQGPSIHWTDLDSFKVGYQLSTSATTLAAEEQFSVKLYLQTLGTTDCLGGKFDLSYSSEVSPDPMDAHGIPENSWLGSASELVSSFSEDPMDPTSTLKVARTDNDFRSGNGWVLTANLVVGGTAINAADAVTALAGGLIVEENMDMKMAALQNEIQSLRIFPNPFAETITVDAKQPEKLSLVLRDLQGNLILRTHPHRDGTIDAHGIPSGIYLMELQSEKGERMLSKKMIRK